MTQRRAGRTRALPNTRAVLGGLLVALAGVGTYAAWAGASAEPTTRFVVTSTDLAAGEVVGPGDLDLVAMDLPAGVAARAFDDAGIVVGQVVLTPLDAGDLVQRSAVAVPEGEAGVRQVSFSLPVEDALAGTMEEGETVDVLATFTGPDGEPTTEVVVDGARVARLVEAGDGFGGGSVIVLLSLPDDADLLAATTAIRTGTVTLVRDGG